MNFLQAATGNYKRGRTSTIKYIVIHYTANNGDTAKGNANYFHNNKNLKASAHYFVDENEIWQAVQESDTAYHCGGKSYKHKDCRNYNAIGIELCSRKDSNGKYYFKSETVARAVELTKSLMEKYNIPTDCVIRHYDVTGKNCPAPFVESPSKWQEFKNKLTESGDLTMTQYEELKKLIVANQETVYHKLDEVPSYGKPTMQKLINEGYYKGETNDLALTETMLRIFVVLDRANMFK